MALDRAQGPPPHTADPAGYGRARTARAVAGSRPGHRTPCRAAAPAAPRSRSNNHQRRDTKPRGPAEANPTTAALGSAEPYRLPSLDPVVFGTVPSHRTDSHHRRPPWCCDRDDGDRMSRRPPSRAR